MGASDGWHQCLSTVAVNTSVCLLTVSIDWVHRSAKTHVCVSQYACPINQASCQQAIMHVLPISLLTETLYRQLPQTDHFWLSNVSHALLQIKHE